ncbi:transcriptional regulator [Xanthobacter tagetidis]|uniref:Transcriptional regulator n=2 Tax=Xanthobacter tagetidis TaxID=60216 RepID=A0A3L7ACW2_9HYPH|nr:transcriptional regulator [Xanthobacter tagetidis]
MTEGDAERLAARLRALGHPARLAALRMLARRDCCPCGDIVRELPLAQSTVSEHLKVLLAAGLVSARPDGQRTHYQIDAEEVRRLKGDLDAFFDRLLPAPHARAERD